MWLLWVYVLFVVVPHFWSFGLLVLVGFFSSFHRLVFQIIFWIKGYIVWHDTAVSTKQLAGIMGGRNIIQVSFKRILKTQTHKYTAKCTNIPPHTFALCIIQVHSSPFHFVTWMRNVRELASWPGYFIAFFKSSIVYVYGLPQSVQWSVRRHRKYDTKREVLSVGVGVYVYLCAFVPIFAPRDKAITQTKEGKNDLVLWLILCLMAESITNNGIIVFTSGWYNTGTMSSHDSRTHHKQLSEAANSQGAPPNMIVQICVWTWTICRMKVLIQCRSNRIFYSTLYCLR